MTLINPFKGWRPKTQFADKVIAPPYDVVDTEQAKNLAKDNPFSFLHLSKAEIDSIDSSRKGILKTAAANLQKLIDKNIFELDNDNCFYIYRISQNNFSQTGLVAAISLQDYQQRIILHENTRPDKQHERAQLMNALNGQLSPTMLAFRAQPKLTQLLDTLSQSKPDYQVDFIDGYQHSLWCIRNTKLVKQCATAFNELDKIYIADGHHRTAAAFEIAEQCAEPNSLRKTFLGILFPDNELNILSYNRIIRDLNGLSEEQLLEKLKNICDIKITDDCQQPSSNHEFALYLKKKWYLLTLKSVPNTKNTIQLLPISLLHDFIIEPIFNITDPRLDKRVDFVGGTDSKQIIEFQVDQGQMTVGFIVYPVTMKQLLQIADKGEVMPPKSTWFAPKLADGLISYRYNSSGD